MVRIALAQAITQQQSSPSPSTLTLTSGFALGAYVGLGWMRKNCVSFTGLVFVSKLLSSALFSAVKKLNGSIFC